MSYPQLQSAPCIARFPSHFPIHSSLNENPAFRRPTQSARARQTTRPAKHAVGAACGRRSTPPTQHAADVACGRRSMRAT